MKKEEPSSPNLLSIVVSNNLGVQQDFRLVDPPSPQSDSTKRPGRKFSYRPNLNEPFRIPSPVRKADEEKQPKTAMNSLNSSRNSMASELAPINPKNSSDSFSLSPLNNHLENALMLKTTESLASVLDSNSFEKIVKGRDRIVDVDLNKFIFGKDPGLLISRGVSKSLTVCISCFDPKGNVLAYGLGNFEDDEIVRFCNSEGKIKDFIDEAFTLKSHLLICLGGMYSLQNIEAIKRQFQLYKPTKFLVLVNPWEVPHYYPPKADHKADHALLEEYLVQELGCTLKIVNHAGHISMSDESLDAGKGFVKFTERAFELWKLSTQNPGNDRAAREHHYKVMEVAKEIYRGRERYKRGEDLINLQIFCIRNKLILEDLLIDYKARGCLFLSDRLRSALFSYLKTKVKKGAANSIHFGLYLETIKKISEYSAEKVIRYLTANPELSPKIVKKVCDDIFPGSIEELFAMESVKSWIATESGRTIAAKAFAYFSKQPDPA